MVLVFLVGIIESKRQKHFTKRVYVFTKYLKIFS